MNFLTLEEVLKKEPPYRLKQVKQTLFSDLVLNWDEVTTLPLKLKTELNQQCPIEIRAKTVSSQNGQTVKAAITLEDGLEIESVLMRHKDRRNTVCVSSQVGCPLACTFCLTGQMGFKRNLSCFEIVEQVLFFARFLKNQGQKITNLVFMGMGEPFLIYENVMQAIKSLNDPEGFNFGARRISLSTVGIVEGIRKLAQENLEVNLAISLHAPNDGLRSKLMPINKKYPIKKILNAVDDYLGKTRRRVMFEYIMIKNINDSDSCADELAGLLRGKLGFVNLISYNPTGKFSASSPRKIERFKKILEKEGIAVTQRFRFGGDIKAACGQLVKTESVYLCSFKYQGQEILHRMYRQPKTTPNRPLPR